MDLLKGVLLMLKRLPQDTGRISCCKEWLLLLIALLLKANSGYALCFLVFLFYEPTLRSCVVVVNQKRSRQIFRERERTTLNIVHFFCAVTVSIINE